MAKRDMQVEKKEAGAVDAVERTRSGKVFIPAVDIVENENELLLIADLPGVDEKSIDLTLENEVLTIEGNVEPYTAEGFELVHQEYESGDYQRSFTLSDHIDKNKIEAEYKNGVLHLRLPKAEKVKPRKIAIKTQ